MFLLHVLTLVSAFACTIAARRSARSHLEYKRQNSSAVVNGTTLEDYEYVVVGSGPGGGPVAARLALNGYKVLLIDAGDDQGNAINQTVPALHTKASEYEPMRWDYFVNRYSDQARQEQDTKTVYATPSGGEYVGLYPPPGSTYKGILYPRSGTPGGCAAHNALISIYPHESDWSNIAAITGDNSWNPDNMRTYFERLERCQYLPNSVVGHGFSGWFGTSVTDLRLILEDQKLLSLIIAAASGMGKSILGVLVSTVIGLAEILTHDINSGLPGRDQTQDLYQIPIATSQNKRNGPRDFILEVANAVNDDGTRKYHLDIRLTCLVTSLRFEAENGTTPTVTGLNFLVGQGLYRADPRASCTSGGTPGSVTATREVILTAGAFNAPQLLKLSGIGPQAELQSFNIPMKVDLPGVGTNLQDRYEVGVVANSNTDFVITKNCAFTGQPDDPCLVQYQTDLLFQGTYTSNGLAVSMVKKSTAAAATDDPDLIITGAPANFRGYFPGYSTAAFAGRPSLAGTVKLRSADPQDVPEINFNYFDTGTTTGGADQLDIQAVADGIAFSRRIHSDVVPLQGTFQEVRPGPNVSTNAEVQQFIENEAWGHHASCTCPVGADDDPMAVLDSDFRVRGVQNPRVVDASAFPKIPGFYIAVAIYIINDTMMTIHFSADLRPIVKDHVGMLHWVMDPEVSGFIIAYDLADNQVLIRKFDAEKHPAAS